MTSSLIYLWNQRERPQIFSHRWFVVWAKRMLQAHALARIFWTRRSLQRKGAKVGALSILYRPDINGKYSNLNIGTHTFISRDVHFAPHAEIHIGSFVCINNGVRILSASHDLSDTYWRMFSKPIFIGDYAWIATGAILLPGIRVGKGAVVGAGAVVTCDVPDYALATGNPAKLSLERRTRDLQYDPVIFAAPYEAWIGRNALLKVGVNVNEVSP